jgi:hypothetical protein
MLVRPRHLAPWLITLTVLAPVAHARESWRLDEVEWQSFVGHIQRTRPRTPFQMRAGGSTCDVSEARTEQRDGVTIERRSVACRLADGTTANGLAGCAYEGNHIVERVVFRTSFALRTRLVPVVLACSDTRLDLNLRR